MLPEWNALPLHHRGAVIDEMRRRMHDLSAELVAGVAGLTRDREETMRLEGSP